MSIPKDILAYNIAQSAGDKRIYDALAKAIDSHPAKQDGAECKIWHRHPVWFLDGNPIVGYSKMKDSVRLLFWASSRSMNPALRPRRRIPSSSPPTPASPASKTSTPRTSNAGSPSRSKSSGTTRTS